MFIGLFLIIGVIGVLLYNSGWRPQTEFASSGDTPGGNTPLEIAKERYARGELSKEAFEQMRHDLS